MKNTKGAAHHHVGETIPIDQDLINWKQAKREVQHLRAQIARAKARGDRRMKRYLQHVLYTSASAKLLMLGQGQGNYSMRRSQPSRAAKRSSKRKKNSQWRQ